MTAQWYYTKVGKQQGPVSTNALRALAASGQLQASDLVWKEGMSNWTASENLGLFPLRAGTSQKLRPQIPVRVASQFPSADVSDTSASSPVHQRVRMRVELPEALVVASGSPWYYALNGKRIGPVSDKGIAQLLAQGTISNGTFVWRAGFDDWIPVAQTTLRKTNTEPPPLTGSSINNSIVWIVAFAPIIGALLKNIIAQANNSSPSRLWFITLVLNIILCGIDDQILKQAGHDTKKLGGWIFLVPVYLYKRATTLNQSLAYFTTWMICFFVSLLI